MNKYRSMESKIRDILVGNVVESNYISFRTALQQMAEKVVKKVTANTAQLDTHKKKEIQLNIIDNA
jgi:hypothetical protein